MSLQPRFEGDLARLPTYAFGHRSLTWWGTIGFMAIEGTGFVLAAGAYFFLANQERLWPPASQPEPLTFSTLLTVVLLLSFIPNYFLKKAAEAERATDVRLGMIIIALFGVALIAIRAFEISALNIAWDRNAYASIVWALLVLHTVHLLTDWGDTIVLAALMFTKHGLEGRRFVDVSENAMYWNFVVFSWLPIYGLIYWWPRIAAGGYGG
jgi:heme/copper-type cytochrome/quinol oxidase subunit 3